MKKNLIRDKSFQFSLRIIGLYKALCAQKEFILSKQLLRSSTSIGANIEESIGAQTRKDFANKLAIALKEARETRYWLSLLAGSKVTSIEYKIYLNEIEDIISILTRIVKTLKIKTK